MELISNNVWLDLVAVATVGEMSWLEISIAGGMIWLDRCGFAF